MEHGSTPQASRASTGPVVPHRFPETPQHRLSARRIPCLACLAIHPCRIIETAQQSNPINAAGSGATMPIRKNKQSGIRWVDIRPPSGPRIRRSVGTTSKQAAQEYHDKLKAELWRIDKLGETPSYTFDQAALGVLKLSEKQRDMHQRRATLLTDAPLSAAPRPFAL